MNRRHRSAQLAGRASVQLHTLMVFSSATEKHEEDAYVLDVDTKDMSEPSFTAFVPRYGIEGCVRISNICPKDESFLRDSEAHRISYKCKNSNKVTSIQVFDKVTVNISIRVEQNMQKELVLNLVHPIFGEHSCEFDDSGESKKHLLTDLPLKGACPKSKRLKHLK